MTMLHNLNGIMPKDNQFNPITRLWWKLSVFIILNHELLEYIKLVEIIVVQVFGFGKNE